jgi:hypothetical protein
MQPRNLLQARFLLLVFYGASSAFGQEKVGIGVSFEPTRLFFIGERVFSSVTTPVNMYIPINFASGHRLEPDFGFFSFSSKRSFAASTEQEEGAITRFGVGGFYLIPTNNALTLYAGPRVGLYFVSSKSSFSDQSSTSTSETKEIDVIVGLNFGGEYFLSSQFSVGAEAQANYISFGEPEETRTPPSPAPVTDRSQHMLSTNALFFVRMYF